MVVTISEALEPILRAKAEIAGTTIDAYVEQLIRSDEPIPEEELEFQAIRESVI